MEKTKGQETVFLKELLRLSEYVRGEARRNQEEYIGLGKESTRFFYDLSRKLETLSRSIFDITNDRILYKPLNILLDGRDAIEKVYLSHIYNAILEIKDCFESYLPIPAAEYTFQVSLSRFVLTVDKSVLNDAYNQLVNFRFIPKNTDKRNFVHIFTGGIVKKPILWLGGYNSLAYFIRALIDKKALFPLKNKHWKEAQKFFITEEGRITDTDSFRNSDPPEDTTNLDQIIDTILTPLD